MGGPSNPGRIKAYLPSGKMKQNFLAAYPVHKYEIGLGLLNSADYESALSFWYIVNFAPYEGFRMKDWRDYRATQANSRCIQLNETDWQLNRVYAFGGVEFLRKIVKPVSGTVTVYRTRSGATTAVTSPVDYTTGIANPVGHVDGDTYTWTGEFDVPVTFVNDEWTDNALEATTQNLQVSTGSIQLEEILF